MTRHIIDHHKAQSASRTVNFLRIDREMAGDQPHPASKALFTRPARRSPAERLRQFARIEHGIET